jgi:hypothetical protein
VTKYPEVYAHLRSERTFKKKCTQIRSLQELFSQKPEKKCFLGLAFFLYSFLVNISSDLKSAYNSRFLKPTFTYSEKKKFSLIEGTFVSFLYENTNPQKKAEMKEKPILYFGTFFPRIH